MFCRVPGERVKPCNPLPEAKCCIAMARRGAWQPRSGAQFGAKCYHYRLEGAPCNVKRLPGKRWQSQTLPSPSMEATADRRPLPPDSVRDPERRG